MLPRSTSRDDETTRRSRASRGEKPSESSAFVPTMKARSSLPPVRQDPSARHAPTHEDMRPRSHPLEEEDEVSARQRDLLFGQTQAPFPISLPLGGNETEPALPTVGNETTTVTPATWPADTSAPQVVPTFATTTAPVPPPATTLAPVPMSPTPPHQPAAGPKTLPPSAASHSTTTSCPSYDAWSARAACRLTHEVEEHPVPWGLAVLLVLMMCYCRFCRRGPDHHPRGEYRTLAATMANDAFGDDFSLGENDDYLSDDEAMADEEGGGGWTNGAIQMKHLEAAEDGLSLAEMNG